MSINFNDHDLTTSGIVTAASGYFTTLTINNSNFNSSVSGLLPTIANSGDNRILTSTGSTVGINAESNLSFDGSLLNVTGSGNFASGLVISNQTASTVASFDTNKNVASLSTATYPSLTELSYVKGVTSAIQTQIDSKAATSITVTAGSGLAGGGSLAANRTIDIGQGDGISVSADSIAVDSTVIRTTGVQTMSGAKTFTAATVFSTGVTISSSGTNVPLTITHDGTGNCLVVNDVTGDSTPFIIDSTGRVGIGTTSPGAELEVADSSSDNDVRINLRPNGSTLSQVGASSTQTFISSVGARSFEVYTNDISRLIVTASGNIGIGTTTPTFVNNTYAGLHIHAATATSLKLTNTATGQTSTDGFELLQDSAGNAYIWNRENTNISIGTSGTSRITISSNGTVTFTEQILADNSTSTSVPVYSFDGDSDTGIGHSSANTVSICCGGVERLYLDVSSKDHRCLLRPQDGVLGRSTSILFGCTFSDGWSGADYAARFPGQIAVSAAGGSADPRDWSMRFLLADGPAGSDTPTERMRISAAGNVGIGTSSISSGFKVDIRGRILSYTTASDGLITVQGLQTASAGTGKSAIQIDVNGNGGFAWQNDASSGTRILKLLENSGYGSGDSELIRVLTGGDVLIGTTTDQGSFKLQVANNAWMDNLYLSTTTNWGRLAIGHNGATTFAAGFNNTDTGSAGQTTVNILRNGTSVGTISTTNAATSYNTNSDYRLKNNVSNMIGASVRLLSLRPVTFEWKVGGSGEGFIAHELAEAVPLAVTGEKDAKDSYGMPIMQSVDHSKLVPLLVAALQEAYAEIANIKSRLSSLEQK